MIRSKLTRNRTHRGPRTLRVEPLEQRTLMAVMPLATLHIVKPAAGPVMPALTAMAEIQGSASSSTGSPTQVYVPETLDGPREGLENPGKFEEFMRDLFASPIEGLLDPGQLPGGGLGPDRERPHHQPGETDREYERVQNSIYEYDNANRVSNLFCDPDQWSDQAEYKSEHWGTGGFYQADCGVDFLPGYNNDEKGTGGKDDGDKQTGGSDDGGNAKPKDEVVDDTDSSGKPIKTDSDPETGGPDKMWLKIEGAALYDESSLPFGQNGSGSTFPGTWYKPSTDSGKGCPWWPRSLMGHRPPRPDEGVGLSAGAGIQSQFLGGAASFPTPDDPDGPDDPRAADGIVLSVGSLQQAASPPDGGQGGEVTPPGPKF